jgi:hypothetical protein
MSSMQTVELAVAPCHDTQLLRFPALEAIPGFVHAITTRPWNMSPQRGPQREWAVQRRQRLCAQLGLPFERLTAADQVHSPHVLRIRECDIGSGREGAGTAMKFVDGLICDFPNVPVMQFSADCPLILAIEPDRRVFGTAHASWRGTVTQIAAELVRMMRVEFGVDPARLRVAICPCAGAEEYEVGEDVYRIAQARLGDVKRFFTVTQGRRFFDMRLANASQLIASGVAAENILSAGASTMSDERFYSHRRDGAETGRFALIAGFRE